MTKKEKQKNTDENISLGSMIGGKIEFEKVDEFLQRKVSKLGNSGHISVPAKHIGKDAQVIIFKSKVEDKKKIN
jgi:putative transposon-encoded protein